MAKGRVIPTPDSTAALGVEAKPWLTAGLLTGKLGDPSRRHAASAAHQSRPRPCDVGMQEPETEEAEA